MSHELREYRKSKAAKRATREGTSATPTRDENTPLSNVRSKAGPPANKPWQMVEGMWLKASSPPKTPSKLRGHVNAQSPLMEVCQNTAAADMRRCRPSASPSQLSFSASPPLRLSSSSRAGSARRESTGLEAMHEDTPEGTSTDVGIRIGHVCDTCRQEGFQSSEGQHAVDGVGLFYCSRCWQSWQDTEEGSFFAPASSCLPSSRLCFHELRAWEDSQQAPAAPPVSPATPYAGQQGRQQQCARLEMQGFMHGLPRSLMVVREEEPAPLRRALLPCLDETGVELPRASPPVATAAPSPRPQSLDGSLAASPAAESPVPLALEGALEDAAEDGEMEDQDRDEVDSVASEADEHEDFLQKVRLHFPLWPPQTILDMEDYLSRSHDIAMFWFFEARDRASTRTANRENHGDLESVPEYPPSWSQWQIDAARSKAATLRARTIWPQAF